MEKSATFPPEVEQVYTRLQNHIQKAESLEAEHRILRSSA